MLFDHFDLRSIRHSLSAGRSHPDANDPRSNNTTGFLTYVSTVREIKAERLFPELTIGMTGYPSDHSSSLKSNLAIHIPLKGYVNHDLYN